MSEKPIYKVIFHYQGQVVELFARHVAQGNLFGFIEVEELIFGARSQVVVDPGEDSLKNEFGGAKRIYLPLHAILRIDEVEREGVSRMHAGGEGGGDVRPFPVPLYPPGTGGGKTK
jgi:hypothetical protein